MPVEIYRCDRRHLMPLFLLADDSRDQVERYFALGEVLVFRDDREIIGHLQMLETGDPGVFELKSLAVLPGRRGSGVGTALVEAAVANCRDRNGRLLRVATAAADIGNLRFYQRRGFRICRVVRDAFGPATGYAPGLLIDGIPLRDQVLFDLVL